MDDHPVLLQKDLGILCNEMQDLLLDVENKMQSSIKRQEQSCINAFKKVKDKMLRQLQNVQSQFYDFKEQMENENLLEVLQNQLEFFRNECFNLSQINKLQKQEIKELKQQIETIIEEKDEELNVLRKLQEENTIVKSTLLKLREEKAQLQIQQKIKDEEQFQSLLKRDRAQSEERNERSFATRKIKIIKKKEIVDNQIMMESDLRKLFKDCVNTMLQEITLRRLQQKSGNSDVKFTKIDQKELMTRFFTNRQILEIIEGQIFGIRCCNNHNCLYNVRKVNEVQVIRPRVDLDERLGKIHKKLVIPGLVYQSQRDDVKIQYQQCVAEMTRLERELVMTSRKEKEKIQSIQRNITQKNEEMKTILRKLRN